MPRHLAAQVLERPGCTSHIVQFYEERSFLFETVGHFLAAGAAAGERLLVIAVPEHSMGIREALGTELVESLLSTGRLTLVDADELLEEFMRGDVPDIPLFREAVARVIGCAEAHAGAPLRAFGEMVDVLWRRGQRHAAIQLEELWNEIRAEHEFSLLCAYTMSNFDRESERGHFLEVCGQHSHVLPTESFSRKQDLGSALREISMLEQRSRLLESEIHSRQEVENALRDAIDRGARGQADLDESLRREAQARRTAEQSDAFREVFVSVLGHDLRNPLNTILTTARLMALRGELAPDTERRLERVIESGVRLERMIAQILDVARDRLASGISISRSEPRDLAPLVAKVVEDVHAAHPNHGLRAQLQRCVASVDAERFEQVAFNLLDNAATHGDSDQPTVVTLDERGRFARLSVRSYGAPMDKESLSLLFDPFRRVRKPSGQSAGLGLGLYISSRIIQAHGGRIHVESSEASGTLFEASFPREP